MEFLGILMNNMRRGDEDLARSAAMESIGQLPSLDYLEKFGPMLKLLDSEADLDFLAAEEGYDSEIGDQYRTVRYQGLQGYRQDLIADFEALYTIAAPIAVSHPELAQLLSATRTTLRRSIRYIGFRMWLELMLPTPSASKGPSPLRRLLVSMVPRLEAPRNLLRAMNTIRDQLQPR
jgi:hypothetical protein